MKEFFLTEHSWYCRQCYEQQKQIGVIKLDLCTMNPERLLLYAGTQFFCITYYECIEHGDKYRFRQELVKKIYESLSKVIDLPLYKVERSVRLEKHFRNIRKGNVRNNIFFRQVNYIYYDNAYNAYAITTEAEWTAAISDNEKLKESYRNAIAYIESKGREYEHLKQQAKQLLYANYIHLEKRDEIKTIESLITQIKHEIQQIS